MKKSTQIIMTVTLSLMIAYLFLRIKVAPFYINRYNKESLDYIKVIDNQSYNRFAAFLNDVKRETDWQIVITSAYRTEEEQAILNEKDARNADAGRSKHNFGKAIDINLFNNNNLKTVWLTKGSHRKHWEQSGVLKIAQKHQLKWGGNFKTYYDPVHFEVE